MEKSSVNCNNFLYYLFQSRGRPLSKELKCYFKNNCKNYCEVVGCVLTLCKTYCNLHMSELVEIVDSLENKISKLLHKIELLNQAKTRLEQEIVTLRNEDETMRNTILEWEERYNSLKLANSMLGSDKNKTEAKLKINTLIRELDYCIVQLSE